MLNLSYVGKVLQIDNIEKADKIELVTVGCGAGGKWSGCAQKNTLAEGDLCMVFLQDAILPETEQFEFMRKHKFRVRMCRFLGVPSEVLIVPVERIGGLNVGDEISELVGVTKYEKPIPVNMRGQVRGNFPSFVPKTDEPNFQAVKDVLDILPGSEFLATLKLDGTSFTAYYNGEDSGVCSRRLELKLDGNSVYNTINTKYQVLDKLKDLGKNIAIQGEIVGPNIQKNPMGLKDIQLFVFNVYDINDHKYVAWEDMFSICTQLNLQTVPVVDLGVWPAENNTFEHFRKYAERKYPNGKHAEGVVIKTGGISFKIINLLYKD